MIDAPHGDKGTLSDMAGLSIRERLEHLIRNSGQGYAAVSRLIGRNPAYIQQFIRRGVPRRLSETDRRLLARHFGVNEDQLGAPASAEPDRITPDSHDPQIVAIPFLDDSRSGPDFLVDRGLISRLIGTHARLAALEIDGDSMAPTLVAGDRVLLDRADSISPRDGIYVIGSKGGLLVKRLSVHPITRRVTILADNPAYPSFPDCDPSALSLVGRVVWVGRVLG